MRKMLKIFEILARIICVETHTGSHEKQGIPRIRSVKSMQKLMQLWAASKDAMASGGGDPLVADLRGFLLSAVNARTCNL